MSKGLKDTGGSPLQSEESCMYTAPVQDSLSVSHSMDQGSFKGLGCEVRRLKELNFTWRTPGSHGISLSRGDIRSGPWHMERCLGHDSHKISPWSQRCKLALHFIAPTQTWTIKTVGEEACVIPRVYSKLQMSNGFLRALGLTPPVLCV